MRNPQLPGSEQTWEAYADGDIAGFPNAGYSLAEALRRAQDRSFAGMPLPPLALRSESGCAGALGSQSLFGGPAPPGVATGLPGVAPGLLTPGPSAMARPTGGPSQTSASFVRAAPPTPADYPAIPGVCCRLVEGEGSRSSCESPVIRFFPFCPPFCCLLPTWEVCGPGIDTNYSGH
ncbi:hypothetical protein T492DRAFT_352500 [Pavlovales sp. CCMP2436]|nr:hypothetical protein T492DRAFT_352500 [Pavlovales sp. CCMP2436]